MFFVGLFLKVLTTEVCPSPWSYISLTDPGTSRDFMGSDRGVPTGWCYCGAHEWGHSKARRMCIDCGLWRRCKQKAHSEGQFDRRLKNFTLKLRWLLRPVNSLFHNIKHPVLILLSSMDGIPLHCRHRFPPPPHPLRKYRHSFPVFGLRAQQFTRQLYQRLIGVLNPSLFEVMLWDIL